MFVHTNMDLPPLPKKRKSLEANVTPRILAWFRDVHQRSCAIEIKATDGDSIPMSALLPHQKAALLAVNSPDGLTHKISDAGHVRTPFDAFQLVREPAYVVAAFTARRIALVIPIEKWHGARYDMDREHQLWRIPL